MMAPHRKKLGEDSKTPTSSRPKRQRYAVQANPSGMGALTSAFVQPTNRLVGQFLDSDRLSGPGWHIWQCRRSSRLDHEKKAYFCQPYYTPVQQVSILHSTTVWCLSPNPWTCRYSRSIDGCSGNSGSFGGLMQGRNALLHTRLSSRHQSLFLSPQNPRPHTHHLRHLCPQVSGLQNTATGKTRHSTATVPLTQPLHGADNLDSPISMLMGRRISCS